MYSITVYNITDSYYYLSDASVAGLGILERYLEKTTILNAEERADLKQKLAQDGIVEIKTWHAKHALTQIEIIIMIDNSFPVYT